MFVSFKYVAAAATLVALSGAPLAPSTPSAASFAAETVDDIVARHLEARGGLERLRAIQTLKITRTVLTPFSTIAVVVYKKRPDFYRAEQSAPGQPLIARGVNAEGAWDGAPGGKAVLRSPALAAEMREIEADFDGLLVDWKAKGHSVTLDGRVPMASGEAYKLTVKTKSGASRTIFLDAATYLDRRHTGMLRLPPSAAAVKQLGDAAPPRQFDVVIDFSGWKEVNGVKFPFDLAEERTSQEPVQSLVTYTQTIEVNVPLEEAFFAIPR